MGGQQAFDDSYPLAIMATSAGIVGFNEKILQSQRPNLFELLAQEAMHEALRPAFQYICKVFTHTRPDLFGRLWQFSDELYLVFESLLQLYFIRKHDGSFSENFYDLKRVPASNLNGHLGRLEKIMSLVCLVFFPYIIVKLERLFINLQEEDDASPLSWQNGDGGKKLIKLIFFKTHPYLTSLWEGLKFVYRLRYLFNQTDFYSPLFRLAGVMITRQSQEDLTISDSPSSLSLLHRVTANLMPLGVFLLKFLEWWYSSERSETVRKLTSLPVPPPPEPLQPSPEGIRCPSSPDLCPLCLKRRHEPTALASSGYVFCYLCILGYLRDHKQCPITCIPSTEQQLFKLFTQQTVNM